MIRIVLRMLAVAVSALLACAVAVAALAFEGTPQVRVQDQVSVADVQRARAVLARHDPRRGNGIRVRTVTLTAQDVTLLLQYARARWRPAAATNVMVRRGAMDVQASLELTGIPFGRWLNVNAELTEGSGLPRIARLTAGRVTVPAFAANAVAGWLLHRAQPGTPLAVASETVKRVRFVQDSVLVEYVWARDAGARIGTMLVPEDDVQRIEAYNAELAKRVGTVGVASDLSLADVLRPMLRLVADRSVHGDGKSEHRAMIATVALYVTGISLDRWIASAAAWPRPARRRVTLNGRDDLAKHFLVSAVLASQSGSALADAVGVTKEVDDAHGGTGFSFVDIAADRAGRRYGELATSNPKRLQSLAAQRLEERDLMPLVTDLPESMTASAFAARFGDVGGPRYEAMLRTIDARLDLLRLFR